jgi:hypothetical protein
LTGPAAFLLGDEFVLAGYALPSRDPSPASRPCGAEANEVGAVVVDGEVDDLVVSQIGRNLMFGISSPINNHRPSLFSVYLILRFRR